MVCWEAPYPPDTVDMTGCPDHLCGGLNQPARLLRTPAARLEGCPPEACDGIQLNFSESELEFRAGWPARVCPDDVSLSYQLKAPT